MNNRYDTVHSDIVTLIPALRAFAYVLTRDATRVDDLVQDALLRSIQHIEKFEPGTSLKSWLFTILKNVFLADYHRRVRQPVVDLDPSSGVYAVPATQEHHVALQEMRIAFALLDHDHREVLLLIGVLGSSYEETAAICGCPVGTVKSRLSRARDQLSLLLQGVASASVTSRATSLRHFAARECASTPRARLKVARRR